MKQNEHETTLPPSELADSELLMRFVKRREQEAFELLVGKYATMVLGVCTQILRDRHEAEDVFQATFLILAQRAHKIQNTSNIGAWLHKTAYRAAVKVAKQRQQQTKRLSEKMPNEIEAADMDRWDSIATQEEQSLLHEELDRMPQRYREPLVLCYLQGMSQTEAADELDLTFGVVNGRMTRGKQMLRMRLLWRGVAFSAVFVTASASVTAAQAASISSLVSVTTETCAATVLHGSTEVFLTKIGTIAQEGVFSMKMTFVPHLAAAAAVLLATMVAWTLLGSAGVSDEPPPTPKELQTAADPGANNVGVAFVAASTEDAPAGRDLDRIQGEWVVVAAHDDGHVEDDIGYKVVITDKEIVMIDKGGRIAMQYVLDSRKDPKWIDITFFGGVSPGIYKIEGDTLTICRNEKGTKRSTAFKSVANTENDVLTVFKRTKPTQAEN